MVGISYSVNNALSQHHPSIAVKLLMVGISYSLNNALS